MHFKAKELIAHYSVLFPHKQGAYAETYRVKDEHGKTGFLKLIDCSKLTRRQLDDSGRVVEVEICKGLQHHNLCTCRETGELLIHGRQFVWFVTEFVSGETLSDRMIREEDFSVYAIKSIALGILSALAYLHSQPLPIIHNEVTTQNVLLNLLGDLRDLKLIDFGQACYLNQSLGVPRVKGQNLFYLAPERFSGVCSVQSDLYAVGAMAYHLLYRRLPWFVDVSKLSGTSAVESLLEERHKPLELPKIEKYELDEQFVNVIAKALSYDAEDRFQTAEEFARAIEGKVKVESPSQRLQRSQADEASRRSTRPMQAQGLGFAAIAGMERLKRQMQEEVIEPLHNPEKYHRYGVTIPNGMLLYGPPGCGKTFFAKHFAEEVGFNFKFITPASLKSKYVNATQENIAALFKEAIEQAPTIIFFDEMNELVPNRDNADVHEMSRSAVNEMLAQMDQTGEKDVFVIGATNYPNMIDPAILRAGRLDKKYYIGVPDQAARSALFKLYLEDRPYDFGLDYEHLAKLTEGYVSADIQLIVNDASREALHQESKITMQILESTIAHTKPSLSEQELKKYEQIRAEMDRELPQQRSRPRIGFKD